MTETRRSIHRFGLRVAVRLPNFVHMKGRKHHAFRVSKGHLLTRSERLRKLLRHVQHHGNRPELSICQPHARADTLVIGARKESSQRRKSSIQQELEITKLSGR